MKNFFFLILGLAIIGGSVFLFFDRTLVKENEKKIIKINETSIEVEVVDTPETRTMGLSNRKTLPEGMGMLFVFDNPVQDGFWMKDMRFAIDIVWIDEKFRVVDIEKEVTPETFPQIFYPNQSVKYVLELPAGYTNQYHIDINAVVQWFD
ncbi:MAG: hypothetical protein UW76_C0003G0016 [Parcubacteria group bacterium GW2011_GWF2_44_8b]|nr:MAG: hypothetical protein UV94_C0008G0031 [Parcubacteria group bacterium GW2011_GWC1_43_30]KKT80877.1 MAG: hypothetical protein UW76_C0003G0016 [Parcubacteria group bacterium GW2011_GWF2_44_8b]KKT86073.1 MAG: hypothetical protein UW83_C0003G0002 [Parcubacteria group bacterium GW2011_GWD1_44_9]